MRGLTLRQLEVFTAVARRLNLSRAAEDLHLSQPAVSMQVKQLERVVGMPLLARVGRRLELTEPGERLLDHAKAVADVLNEAGEALDALRGLKRGTLRLSAVSTAKYFAPALLAAFSRVHPGIASKISIGNREEIVRELRQNDTDLVIMGRPPREIATTAVPIARHPLAIIAAPEHPLCRARRISLERVAAEPLIIREVGSGTRASMERVFRERGIAYHSTMEVGSNETIKQAVMAGMGLSFISLHTVGLELQAGRLAVLDVVGLPLIRDWYLIHREDKRLGPAALAFAAFVRESAAALIERAAAIPTPKRASRALR